MKRILALLLASPLLAAAAVAEPPSFDCAKADSDAEKLVCQDDTLAALDREMAHLYGLARDQKGLTAEEKSTLKATQRGWIKGRNDCWKAEDQGACVRDAYLFRIDELLQGYPATRGAPGEATSLGPFEMHCDGQPASVGLIFVNVEPPLAYLTWDQLGHALTIAPSGSGARYTGKDAAGDYELWNKGNDATFTLPDGKQLACTISPAK